MREDILKFIEAFNNGTIFSYVNEIFNEYETDDLLELYNILKNDPVLLSLIPDLRKYQDDEDFINVFNSCIEETTSNPQISKSNSEIINEILIILKMYLDKNVYYKILNDNIKYFDIDKFQCIDKEDFEFIKDKVNDPYVFYKSNSDNMHLLPNIIDYAYERIDNEKLYNELYKNVKYITAYDIKGVYDNLYGKFFINYVFKEFEKENYRALEKTLELMSIEELKDEFIKVFSSSSLSNPDKLFEEINKITKENNNFLNNGNLNLKTDNEEYLKNIKEKYNNYLYLFQNNLSNDFIDKIDYEEYKKNPLLQQQEELFIKFINEGHRDAYNYAIISFFSENTIKYIISNYSIEEREKDISFFFSKKDMIFNILNNDNELWKRLVRENNFLLDSNIADHSLKSIENLNITVDYINKYINERIMIDGKEEIRQNKKMDSTLRFINDLLNKKENDEFNLTWNSNIISEEVANYLVDNGLTMINPNKARFYNPVVIDAFLRHGEINALSSCSEEQFNKYFDKFDINKVIDVLNNYKYKHEEKMEIDEDEDYKRDNYPNIIKSLIKKLLETKNYEALNRIINNENIKYIPKHSIDLSIEEIESIFYTQNKEEIIKKLINAFSLDNELFLIKNDKKLIMDIEDKKNISYFNVERLFSNNIPWGDIEYYNGNAGKLIYNYDKVLSFINKLGIENDFFIKNVFGNTKYNWLDDIIYINDNNLNESFVKFVNLYQNNKEINASNINGLFNLLNNYIRYNDLCVDIVNKNRPLSEDEINNLTFLFSREEKLEDSIEPKKLEEITSVKEKIKNNYINNIKIIYNINNYYSLDQQKNLICKIIFNNSLDNCKQLLYRYGNVEELKKLMFNDRYNKVVTNQIKQIMIFTSMIEDIVNCNDKDAIMTMLFSIKDNFDLAIDSSTYFTKYEDYMKLMYENETNYMLTKIDKVNKTTTIDDEMSKEIGTDVYDFTDKRYILLTHVKSNKETIEELATGVPLKGHGTICFAPISDRNLKLYDNRSTIFLYDHINKGSFIMSNRENIGSNGFFKYNSTEIENPDEKFVQRGIREVSEASNSNPEMLCFREGIKPFGLALPGGRKPTEAEMEIAKQYGLVFVKTQSAEKEITNPKEIDSQKNIEVYKSEEALDKLKELRNKLINVKSNAPRRFAIFTDSHALFEPTLAVLEDIRRNGISEIYSLGDNIGTGPNPDEVMDLLEEYNVKSIKGNHELYTLVGVDKFKDHLNDPKTYEEANRNSNWTRRRLKRRHLETINALPNSIDIKIGGKNILLTHYTKDYNTGKNIYDTSEYSSVFQGHIHSGDIENNIITLDAAGLGKDKEYAHYVIVEEKPEGGYRIIPKDIPFDNTNLKYSIIEGGMEDKDREKIADWTTIRKAK